MTPLRDSSCPAVSSTGQQCQLPANHKGAHEVNDGLGTLTWEPLVFRDKMRPDEFYDALDPGIRFPVKVLHAYGIDTCQSCEGGPGHSYPAPTVDLLGSACEVPAFAALHYLEAYGLEVYSLAEVWNVSRGRIHEAIWRVELRRPHSERAGEWPMFVWGYRSQP